MAKTKKDTNARPREASREAGRRKRTKESAGEQLCMDNIPVGLNESDDSSASDSTAKFKIFIEPLTSHDSLFLPD